jgi:predicted AAA+ superfamily ATPase
MINRAIRFPARLSTFLLGPRQTGKSTLIRQEFGATAWMVDLLGHDTFLRYSKQPSQFRKEAEYQIDRHGIRIICVDEIQRIPELLGEVQALIEEKKVRFILTGSSARKLRRGGTNLLGGRAAETRIHPFTVEELGGAFDLDTALHHGTLPPVWGKEAPERIERLKAYAGVYLQEEIRAEGLARNIGGFSRFLDMAAQQSGELVSYSAVARECGLPVRTVQSYYDILEDTLIGFRLPGWRHTIRKQLSSHPKYFLFDTGVTNAINGMVEGALDSRLKGRLFEQFIVLETRRRLDYAGSATRLFYWRTNHGAEVDLILERRGKAVAALEIKYSESVTSASLKGLKPFREENPDVPCMVVARVPQAFMLDGFEILPWRDYLEKLDDWK